MTEDDTFRILSRKSVDEVNQLYMHWFDLLPETWTIEKADKFLMPHGWTFGELYAAMNNGCPPPEEWYE